MVLGGAMVKNLPANARDSRNVGPIPGWGRSSEKENGNPLQHACLGKSHGQGSWKSTVHGVTESQT